ncbi:MAG: hypothetical protein VXZ82_16850 [Planctomycetota bacterium]|nr:hypothetical protein [Planctomycetota bacterium]
MMTISEALPWNEALPVGQTRIIYQWLRIEQLSDWWHWLLVVSICTAILGYVLFWYRRDSAEQHRPVGWTLMMFRIAALIGLLLFFLQLEKRSEQRVVRDSRVAVLVDTSMSMSLPGTPSSVGVTNTLSRAEEAKRLIADSEFLRELSAGHQVSVYRFDDDAKPSSVAAVEKIQDRGDMSVELVSTGSEQQTIIREMQLLGRIAIILCAVALVGICLPIGAQVVGIREWVLGSWMLFLSSVAGLVSLICGAVAVVPNTEFSLASTLGLEEAKPIGRDDLEEEAAERVSVPDDWQLALSPSGTESRLGDAVKFVLEREASNPLAGIILLTDGRNNAGFDPKAVLPMTQISRVPLFVIGLGSAERPKNIELVEIDAPKRVYPGDRFTLKGLLGSNGFDGESVDLQVLSGPVDAELDQLSIEDETQVTLQDGTELQDVEFQLEPKPVGEWQYALRINTTLPDSVEKDNVKLIKIEVVERKNRVLIIAGGPMREYQFVRNLLYRDRDVESHVLLQSGSDRSSQESQKLLSEFPADIQALSEYDAVISFDADWTQIPDASVLALERWVAEQAGGFILVAGSVEMPKWVARSATGVRSQLLRSLSPVVLKKTGSALLASGRVTGQEAWPLKLSSDGAQAEYLWMTEEAKSSLDLWQDFEGVYSFFAAYELKPGAKALMRYSDPTTAIDGQQPVYMASQFYGAGRTLFLGGGELWRIRASGDFYFDRLYTKLVRWVSQGRLLLDSDRGVLLVDREQALLGDTIMVRAVLKDERFEPLVQTEVVPRLLDPQGGNRPLVLRPMADGSQPGVYTGQFPVLRPGEYSVQLQLGGLASDEVLLAAVKAKVPALEMQRAERNDTLLKQLAADSGGRYWAGVESAVSNGVGPDGQTETNIVDAIEPQDQIAYLPGAPDSVFQLRWLGWLMTWIASCLCLEWLIRRIHRLA